MKCKPESTNELLSNSPLRSLLERVEKHGEILRIVREALPPSLAGHCKDCLAREDQRLVIFTDSPAWASQLRFYVPTILVKLKTPNGYDFRDIQVRNLRFEAPSNKVKSVNAPSLEVARMIKESGLGASSVELRKALERLSVTIERYTGRN